MISAMGAAAKARQKISGFISLARRRGRVVSQVVVLDYTNVPAAN